MARVDAVLRGPDGTILRGRLWDISPAGAGLQFDHSVDLSENDLGELVLRHSYSQEELQLQVQVCWVNNSPTSSLVGTIFGGGLLPKRTFLDPYL